MSEAAYVRAAFMCSLRETMTISKAADISVNARNTPMSGR